jgi:hypothetical protein
MTPPDAANIVEKFTRKNLTYHNDRQAAIAGIVCVLKQKLPVEQSSPRCLSGL